MSWTHAFRSPDGLQMPKDMPARNLAIRHRRMDLGSSDAGNRLRWFFQAVSRHVRAHVRVTSFHKIGGYTTATGPFCQMSGGRKLKLSTRITNVGAAEFFLLIRSAVGRAGSLLRR